MRTRTASVLTTLELLVPGTRWSTRQGHRNCLQEGKKTKKLESKERKRREKLEIAQAGGSRAEADGGEHSKQGIVCAKAQRGPQDWLHSSEGPVQNESAGSLVQTLLHISGQRADH